MCGAVGGGVSRFFMFFVGEGGVSHLVNWKRKFCWGF